MASLNPLTQELVFKIVFYGPGLGGKTTTLQHIHSASAPDKRGKLVSLATPTDRTLYFDFLPLRLQKIRNMTVRLQLFTVPGQVYYSATRKLVLTGADGIVFVADSQTARLDANQESLEDLNANLADHGRALSQLPHTFQWNKRDLSEVVSEDELDRRFNLFSAPSIGTSATRGDGVFEGLEQITKLTMETYRAELPNRREIIMLLDEETSGIADAIRGLAESPRPKPVEAPPARREKSPLVAAMAAASAQQAQQAQQAGPGQGAQAAHALARAPDSAGGSRARPDGSQSGSYLVPTVSPSSQGGTSFSMAELWPEVDRDAVRKCEHLLAAHDTLGAIMACDVLLSRVLAFAAGLCGSADAPRDPALVCLLLGLDGRRYVKFRALVRAARQSDEVIFREALECFSFVVEARRNATGLAASVL
ncbi:GTPase domain-containing protein [Pendulispora brunnea]|uniref:GTPase domain-containing protein n=1 Tax=Pendulispora brunnea TaxID=2905690 RepID=A0ABZ2KJX0_9BACT